VRRALSVLLRARRSAAYHAYLYRIGGKEWDGLHLGSSGSRIRGFCNIDANPRAPCDVVARVDRLKLRSNSAKAIYSSHVFEHIPREQARAVLAEWHRVLKPNGTLYLCVPDLAVLFKTYLDNLPHYDTDNGKCLVDRACYIVYGGQYGKYDFHYYGYSFATLKHLLESVGFTGVARFDRAKIDFLNFPDVSLATINDVPMSLNVEAYK
jgi:predicted SAM-dependent methyltransferase